MTPSSGEQPSVCRNSPPEGQPQGAVRSGKSSGATVPEKLLARPGILEERHRWVLFAVVTGLVFVAWLNRFVLDDAFISFRYALNLAEGNGLVYNSGERVEEYTNFLWTLLMVIPHRFGIDPVPFSWALGLLFFIASLPLTYRTAFVGTDSHAAALLAVVILGTNYTYSSFATGGLETQMHACLVLAAFCVVLSIIRQSQSRLPEIILLSVLMAAAFLTRMDSAVFLAIACTAAVIHIIREDLGLGAKSARLAALIVPAAAMAVPWLVWKLYYYGDIFPNTYCARVASGTSSLRGAAFVLKFYWSYWSYWLLPLVFLLVIYLREILTARNWALQILLAAVVLWTVYVIRVGGCFMEFRLFVPIMPMLAIMIAWLMVRISSRAIRAALVLLILCGSIHHALTFRWDSNLALESIKALAEHLTREHWIDMGKALGKWFRGQGHVVIATAGAGAIEYFSGLPTIDLLGLNDRWVGREGPVVSDHPGHQRRATLAYLRKRRVTFVIHGVDRETTKPTFPGP